MRNLTMIALMLFSLLYFSSYTAEALEKTSSGMENKIHQDSSDEDEAPTKDSNEENKETEETHENLEEEVKDRIKQEEITKDKDNNSNKTDSQHIDEQRKTQNKSKKESKSETIKDDNSIKKLDESSRVLRRGQVHADVVTLKVDLANLGFVVSSNPTKQFGPKTERIVKEFQEYYDGLEVTGEADQKTLAKIEEVLSSSLRRGQRDPALISIKSDMADLGFVVSSNPTNQFGPKTESTVKSFQQFYGLKVTGVVEEVTLNKIKELLNAPLKRGDYRKDVILMKEKLAKLGFVVSSNPTKQFGPKTERIVKEFQEYYDGLEVTGEADQKTLAKIEEVLSSSLRRGQRDSALINIKSDMADLGFVVSSNPTNQFGSKTERIVKELQTYYGLRVTGVIDIKTKSRIEEVLSASLRRGQRDSDLVSIKSDMADLGFVISSNPTNQFGPKTESTVKSFQQFYGLKVTGVVEEITLNKIKELLNTPMKRGDYRKDVILMKEKLAKLGFVVSSNPTEQFGPKTERIVKEFQEYYEGLEVTGEADQETLAKIEEVLSSSLRRGQRDSALINIKSDMADLGFVVSSNPTNQFGSKTERIVKELQTYYGLRVTGVIDIKTKSRIEEVLSASLRRGQRDSDLVSIKSDMADLGFVVSSNPTDQFGPKTESTVKDFQKHYSLVVNGILDEPTLTKIKQVLSSPYRDGKSGKHVVKLKNDLTRIGFGNFPSNPSNKYGPVTAGVVKDFQEQYNLPISGIADEITLAKIQEAINGRIETRYNISLEQALDIQMKAKPQTDNNYAYVSKKHIKNDQVTANALNVRSGAGTNNARVGQLSKGDKVKILEEVDGWYVIEFRPNQQWVDARARDVKYYLNPANFIHDSIQQFQFLDLSRPSGASKTALNNYLKGKGILDGQANAFMEAGRKHGINDVYLISHATLETGNGSSKLASGVEHKGVTVYNMYGIGAYDSCPLKCGVERAYEEGWTTPEKAIIGGAEFIGNGYIKQGQNTLYKMRWDPEAMESTGRFGKQYATDVGWASKQITTMYNLYQQIDDYVLSLDIPNYK